MSSPASWRGPAKPRRRPSMGWGLALFVSVFAILSAHEDDDDDRPAPRRSSLRLVVLSTLAAVFAIVALLLAMGRIR